MVEVRLGSEKWPVRILRRGVARVSAAFIAATALLAYGGDTEAGRFDFDATPGRLPKHVVPSHYALEFELDPASDVFTGRAEIELEIRRPTSEIVLQANELQAISATLVSAAGTERDNAASSSDDLIWVVVGDLPSAYFVIDEADRGVRMGAKTAQHEPVGMRS